MSDMRDAIGVLLAGGQGERLWPLTRDRAKPAVPFGGVYRIIDITLSNCINSDLRRVFVLTQYKALSLNRHIRAGWSSAGRPGRLHRSSPPADARLPALVPGHRRRRLPEHLLHRQRALEVRLHPLRRPHLQDELPQACSKQHVDSGADVTVATIEIARRGGRRGNSASSKPIKTGASSASRKSPLLPRNRATIRSTAMLRWASTSSIPQLLIPILLADSEDPQLQPRFRQGHSSAHHLQAPRLCLQFRG